MTFTDDDLKQLKESIQGFKETTTHTIHIGKVHALLARLEAAELKECNQYHCGHASCNEWRKATGE